MIDPTLAGQLMDRYARRAHGRQPDDGLPLDAREQHVLRLVGGGHTQPEIAEELEISQRTVQVVTARIRRKTGRRRLGESGAASVELRQPAPAEGPRRGDERRSGRRHLARPGTSAQTDGTGTVADIRSPSGPDFRETSVFHQDRAPMWKSDGAPVQPPGAGRLRRRPVRDRAQRAQRRSHVGRLTDPTKSNNLPLGSHPAAGDRARERWRIRLEQRTVFERPGRYHLELLLLNSARAVRAAGHEDRTGRARVVPERPRMRATLGQRVRVRFHVIGRTPGDAQVLALSTSSGAIDQSRAPARRAGVLEASITPPAPGSYRLSLLSESQDLAGDGNSGVALPVGTASARRRG